MKFLLLILVLLSSSLVEAQVNNPSTFVGQRIFGATSGAPIYVSSGGTIASGMQITSFVSSSTTITRNAAAQVLMTDMTLSPPFTGTFKATCDSTFTHNTSAATITVTIYSNGAQVGISKTFTPTFASGAGLGAGTSNIPIPVTWNSELTLTAGQAVECRWGTSTGTASSIQRSLMLEMVR